MLPIIPPMVQRLWVEGSGPKRSPYGATAACSEDWTTPGCTVAVRPSGSTAVIACRWRAVSSTSPAPTALPAHEVPAPRVVTGIRTARAASSTATVSSTERGWATACGTTR